MIMEPTSASHACDHGTMQLAGQREQASSVIYHLLVHAAQLVEGVM